ncbi:MAG: YkvA family protein [Acidimicrobiia bacterium]
MWWLLGVALGLAVCWLLLVVVLHLRRPDEASIRESLRLLPDIIRLVKRLATDKHVPVATRVLLWLLVVYLVSPVDLVPDFLPVVGLADDAILVVLVLRHVIRRAGESVVTEQWPGTDAGLATLRTLTGRATS